jgi:hypothetical protein
MMGWKCFIVVLMMIVAAIDCVIVGMKIQESLSKNQNDSSNQKKESKNNNG